MKNVQQYIPVKYTDKHLVLQTYIFHSDLLFITDYNTELTIYDQIFAFYFLIGNIYISILIHPFKRIETHRSQCFQYRSV